MFAQRRAARQASFTLNIAEAREKLPRICDLGCCGGQRGDGERTGDRKCLGNSEDGRNDPRGPEGGRVSRNEVRSAPSTTERPGCKSEGRGMKRNSL